MEKPSYFEDNYAAKFLTGKTVFPDDRRIFHRPECEYDEIAALGNAFFIDQTLTVDFFYRSGAPGFISIRAVMPGVLRIQVGRAGAQFDETSPMLLPQPEFDSQAGFESEADRFSFTLSGYRLELEKFPFCLRVISPQGETIFELEWEKIVDLPTAPPAGLRKQPESEMEPAAFLSWRMRVQDRWFGLGEKFTRFEKTGTRATIWQADTCGSNTTDMSYKAVPVVFSTAGWALMLHSSFRSFWELGSFSYATGGLLVEDSRLDLFLILAPTLKAQVQAYTALTGRPQMPPRWAFGLWMSRAAYQNRAQLLEVASRLRQEEIPCDVINIDPTWMERGYYNDIGVEVCNFNWNAPDWGQPEALFDELKQQGFGICLWINPYFSEDSPAYAEASQKGYLVKTLMGGTARLEFDLAAGIIDLTHPEAKAWWQEKLADLVKKGAAVFKVDFGDRVPENALFANGKTGREMHNLFVHLYAQAVYEVVERVQGAGIIWRRPGYIGSQRYPGSWAGDTQVTWEGMAGALRGGLSAAFTGEAFWSHDIGGFVGQKPSDELYIRWMQFGLLSPFARFHGTTPREPWEYGGVALEVAKHYIRLRYALMPYLLAYGQESVDSGLPLLRPMVLEFPDEPRVDVLDHNTCWARTCWCRACVPGRGAHPHALPAQRTVVAVRPPGQYGQRARLPRSRSTLSICPCLRRAGAVIPRHLQAVQHLKGPAPRQWLLDIYPGDAAARHLVIAEEGYTLRIDYHCEGGMGRLEVSPAPVSLAVRMVDRRPAFLRAASGVILQPGNTATGSEIPITSTADAAAGLSIEFRA